MEKTTEKIVKKFTSRMQARLLLVFCVVALLLIGLMGRLVYIVQTNGDKYAKQVLSRQSYVSAVLPYKRGDILDSTGIVLAHSELQFRLILDPKLLLENGDCITTTMKALKDNFKIDADTINSILQEDANKQYVILKKNLSYDTVQTFEKKKLKDIVGVWFEEEYVRNYPNNALACDLVGFASADNNGFYGIEEFYNEELNGINGREYGYYDSNLNIDRIEKKAVNGNTVVTTINADVQRIIQKKIKEFNSEIGSKNIGVLVMDPNSGGVIAMASNQEFNLNEPRNLEGIYTKSQLDTMTDEQKTNALNALWKNDAISWIYEPGSTFKPFTVASALEENLVSDNSTYLCDGGEEVSGRHIACSHVHGELSLGGSIIYSCNDAMMQIAKLEGKNLFYQYEKNFGFAQKTGIDLPGEESGLILSLDQLSGTGIATSSFGQSTCTTMLQLASGFCSLVNGGSYYQPHIMKKIVNDSGSTLKDFGEILVKKTVSEQTSKLLKNYLYQTVEMGTATKAKVDGYHIGGKTGTAEKGDRSTDDRVVSFIGCAPAENPRMVIYVVIDEPQNVDKQESGIPSKLAGEIMNEILPVLGIYPDGDVEYYLPTVTPIPMTDPVTEEPVDTPSGDTQQNTEDFEGAKENGNAENSEDTGNTKKADDNQKNNTQETGNQDTGAGDSAEQDTAQ